MRAHYILTNVYPFVRTCIHIRRVCIHTQLHMYSHVLLLLQFAGICSSMNAQMNATASDRTLVLFAVRSTLLCCYYNESKIK